MKNNAFKIIIILFLIGITGLVLFSMMQFGVIDNPFEKSREEIKREQARLKHQQLVLASFDEGDKLSDKILNLETNKTKESNLEGRPEINTLLNNYKGEITDEVLINFGKIGIDDMNFISTLSSKSKLQRTFYEINLKIVKSSKNNEWYSTNRSKAQLYSMYFTEAFKSEGWNNNKELVIKTVGIDNFKKIIQKTENQRVTVKNIINKFNKNIVGVTKFRKIDLFLKEEKFRVIDYEISINGKGNIKVKEISNIKKSINEEID